LYKWAVEFGKVLDCTAQKKYWKQPISPCPAESLQGKNAVTPDWIMTLALIKRPFASSTVPPNVCTHRVADEPTRTDLPCSEEQKLQFHAYLIPFFAAALSCTTTKLSRITWVLDFVHRPGI
jgi:hypothetical protein